MILSFFKTYKKTLTIFIVLILLILYFLNKYNTILNQKEIDVFVSNKIKIVEDEIENQKNQALSLALMFSQNQEIIKNLRNKNSKELKEELLKLLLIISTYTKLELDIQVHTKDLEVFARSWEDKDFLQKLSSFREGLNRVKTTEKPYVSSELGKRFNIKAIAPIFDKNGDFLGSIEVIVDFKDLVLRLKNIGVSSAILLENEFLDIATIYKDSKKIDDFSVIYSSFDNYDSQFISNILKANLFFIEQNNKFYSKVVLGNFQGKNSGLLVVSFDKLIKNFVYLPSYSYYGDIKLEKNQNIEHNNLEKEIKIR
ncbi:cache domain-containing protein [Aliarcobacter butzleri]|uniref:Cache domain-containing protein n=1 Tax=Aliarcobacter butzleri TaxID=28197 RepID=A0AAW7QB21_9BACT|nr:cache domain-containing protein [Aliarcobacter butzleri]MDN5106581.1 cache domain-containing protein [Aliarcobacter butzleri]MDN5123303.1 cache domain-containing protein [Aliarcobacter butzleri]